MGDTGTIRLVCARCRGALGERREELFCARCAVAFPTSGGIADFAEGRYYDDFPGPEVLSAENLRGLANESEGARIEDFYRPLLERLAAERGIARPQLAVLDSGCGNGESVDVLSRASASRRGATIFRRSANGSGVSASGAIASSWRRGRRCRFPAARSTP